MRVRAFAVDIDGTLTENGSKVHLQSLSLLRALERSGYRVLFVSGRSSIEAYILAMFLGTTRVAIGENGGVITTSPTEHILLVERDYSERAYELLRSRLRDVRLKPVFPRMTEVVLERTFSIDEAMSIVRREGLPVVIVDSMYAYHINHERINKAVGLRIALETLGIKPEECVAIGDSATDVPLFLSCGYSIAIGNADDGVKSMAKASVKGRNGNGLLEALNLVIDNMLDGTGTGTGTDIGMGMGDSSGYSTGSKDDNEHVGDDGKGVLA
ncbi:MAG: phosphoglycolate phosphatase [Candidatus Nitrosocaldus sp.]|nr:phosphoglycolate phosphatase [Candidatus Nitrosocaldus sp.]MCS7140629.1 phosphoglycolate phosphatase [Candidatus Nitrosocaldus sp.]MDW7999556.1 phosphoglycolate phosphatase [Candidatus Nitrosocaldus sp.]MDW8276209.1 phosphoglycolate phosphatase [Candidatus Nitrosocaldus sp.]